MYHATRTITPTQLVVAVQSHAGHGEGAEVDLSEASAAVAKAVAMDSTGKKKKEEASPQGKNRAMWGEEAKPLKHKNDAERKSDL